MSVDSMVPDRSGHTAPWPRWQTAVAVVAALAIPTIVGLALGGVGSGDLIDTDSYMRVSRLVASVEAGRLLDHVPRDNGGMAVPMHWSHLLDAAIMALALPLFAVLPTTEALRWAGAAIGPVSSLCLVWAMLRAVRAIDDRGAPPLVAMALALLAPGITAYGALGRADHHVFIAAVAVATPALAWASGGGATPRREAMLAGAIGGLGVWLSPEALPFVLFGWAVALLRDAAIDRRPGARGEAFALGFALAEIAGVLIDPSPSGRLASEIDRLSLPYLELAVLMLAAAALGRRLVRPLASPWLAAMAAGVVGAAAAGLWVAHYPTILQGTDGIFSPEARSRIWQYIQEVKPVRAPGQIALMLAMPTAILAAACGWLAWTRRDPTAVLVAVFALFVLAIGYRHVRFAMYPELAAALVVAAWSGSRLRPRGIPPSAPERSGESAARPGGGVLVTAATLALAVGPYAVSDLFESASWNPGGGASCTTRLAAPALRAHAGRVVLAPFSLSPEVLFFSGVVTVAGPYHRAEARIIASLDALAETRFADAMPASFEKTGAVAVLVCVAGAVPPDGTLAAALATGRAPPWLIERPVDPKSGLRLYERR